ncbi:glycosyltransferase family 4 protein [Sporichthya brevicatena]|uniref:Glycosyltransferase family 4 protein n=1 Tax=Sporichthya brevicatena TaxID=171442 RepID=A0ABN1GCG4_9ACTN
MPTTSTSTRVLPTPSPDRPLRIAMVAPPYFSIPPKGYGGIEAVVADLVDELVADGHHVTLIGAGPHGTKATEYVSTFDEPPSRKLGEPLPEVVHAARVAQIVERGNFDIVHDHTLAGPLLARATVAPTVVTMHGPLEPDPLEYYRALGGTVHLIGISDAQRRPAPDLPWLGTVHNGIRVETFPFQPKKENFALFMGRFHPQKAPHLAIDAARAAGMPITLAGKCQEPVEKAYFEAEIAPRIGPDVSLFGVADAVAKRQLYRRAACLLFPICWEEPFGLVMVEAMACGTPVVALRRGSVPEVVRDGVTGVVVDSPDELPAAIEAARVLSPQACRDHVATSFSTERMAHGYVAAYRKLLAPMQEPAVPAVRSVA